MYRNTGLKEKSHNRNYLNYPDSKERRRNANRAIQTSFFREKLVIDILLFIFFICKWFLFSFSILWINPAIRLCILDCAGWCGNRSTQGDWTKSLIICSPDTQAFSLSGAVHQMRFFYSLDESYFFITWAFLSGRACYVSSHAYIKGSYWPQKFIAAKICPKDKRSSFSEFKQAFSRAYAESDFMCQRQLNFDPLYHLKRHFKIDPPVTIST